MKPHKWVLRQRVTLARRLRGEPSPSAPCTDVLGSSSRLLGPSPLEVCSCISSNGTWGPRGEGLSSTPKQSAVGSWDGSTQAWRSEVYMPWHVTCGALPWDLGGTVRHLAVVSAGRTQCGEVGRRVLGAPRSSQA